MRSTVIEALADVVMGLQLEHPTRVGIDGRSAAGKTTLANELATTIQLRGRAVVRAELDDFHRPGHKFRSMRGEWTPETRLFDSYHDVWLPEEWHFPPQMP